MIIIIYCNIENREHPWEDQLVGMISDDDSTDDEGYYAIDGVPEGDYEDYGDLLDMEGSDDSDDIEVSSDLLVIILYL